MNMSGSQAMVRCLEAEGVEVLFGYPGAAICPFYDSLSASKIRHVLVRQEQNAGHAASGYARIAKRPGVCVVTSGPGAANLVTGLATAYMDSIPLVAITGQVSSELLGRDVFQETDTTGMCAPFIKHSYLVKDAADIGRVFKEAFHIASTGRQGPVLIDVPVDVQNQTVDFRYPDSVSIRGYKPSVRGHAVQIKRTAAALAAAKRPLLCAGGGIFGADCVQALRTFAESVRIPVVCTMMGLGAMPTDHPLFYGMVGMYGGRCANRAVSECDLLLVVGARIGDRSMQRCNTAGEMCLVHIDIDPAEIGKNVGTNIPIVGDAGDALDQLLKLAPAPGSGGWLTRLDLLRNEPHEALCADGIDPVRFFGELSAKARGDAVVVCDVGLNQIWTAQGFRIRQGRLLSTCGMGTMGYSLPAACGAALAAPGRQVLAVCGDGAFQMNLNELATMRQNGIPARVIVVSNRSLGMVREIQHLRYDDRIFAVALDALPDFSHIAAAYGLPYRLVEAAEQAAPAMDDLLALPDGCLLELRVPENLGSGALS